MTIFLIEASHFVVNYFYVVFMRPCFFWIIIKLLYRNKTGAYVCDRILLMIPVMGAIVEKSTVARTMRTLGTLVQSGVPILESLNIVRDTAGNAVFERAFTRIYESIREGETIAQPLREARIVDDIVVNMIDVGEETGDLDTMLNKIADNYDEEVEAAGREPREPARADHDRRARRHHRVHRHRPVPAADHADQQAVGLRPVPGRSGARPRRCAIRTAVQVLARRGRPGRRVDRSTAGTDQPTKKRGAGAPGVGNERPGDSSRRDARTRPRRRGDPASRWSSSWS